MKIYKIIISLLATVAMLGFTRVYALDLGGIADTVGSITDNKTVQKYSSEAQKIDQQYNDRMAIKKRIQSINVPEQAFNVLTQNSDKLGIKADDMKDLSTAFAAANVLAKTGSSTAKTIDQLSKDPAVILSNPQTLAQTKINIDNAISAFDALGQSAAKLSANNPGSATGTSIGNSVNSVSKEAADKLRALRLAINGGNSAQTQAAANAAAPAVAAVPGAAAPGTIAAALSTSGTSPATVPLTYTTGIKNWENQGALILNRDYAAADIQTRICNQMFLGDERNLFKDVICSLIRVVSASTAQFSTQMTCNIQRIPVESNYLPNIGFAYSQGVCKATNTTLNQQSYVYGVQSNSTLQVDNGFYANQNSTLTNALIDNTGSAKRTFEITKWILAFAALVVLLLFAFANILNLEMNTYAIKKALPKVIVALIGGWLSLSFIALISKFVDVAYQLNIFSPYQSLHPMANIFMGNFSSTSATSGQLVTDLEQGISLIFDLGGKFLGNQADNPSLSAMILGSFFLIVPAIAVLIFEYVLALRPFVVGILAAIGPLAFASIILPQTQFLFKKWATYLGVALFYPLAVNFVFFFLNKIDGSYGNGAFFAIWAFKIFVILVLVRLPFAAESDVRRISQKIAASGFGASLGLNKIFGKGVQPTGNKSAVSGATGGNLSSEKAKGLIAPAAKRFFRNIVSTTQTSSKNSSVKPSTLQTIQSMPNDLSKLILNAHQINLGRNSGLIQKSIKDLPNNTLRAVVDRNDLQLWRDTRLIEQLKNKDGQVLDDQAAAIRIDSVRKAMRLSQVAENGKLTNGDMIKLIAGKGMLSSLPNDLVREALRQNILSKEDLVASYGQNYQRVLESAGNSLISPAKAGELMAQDNLDYLTGFNEIKNGINAALRSGNESAPQVISQISRKMKESGASNLNNNYDYFLKRLANDKNRSVTNLAGTLYKAGVDSKSAASLAQNSAINFDQMARYIPKQNQNEASSRQIREGLLSRDVTGGLIREISNAVTQEKTTAARGITLKMAEVFKNDKTANIPSVEKAVQETKAKLSGPLSPTDIDAAATQISRYHPGAKIKTDQKYDQNDIDQIKERAQEVLETTDKLQKTGLDEKKIAQNPIAASQGAEREIAKEIEGKARGEVANAPGFDQELNGFAKVIENKA